MTDIKPSEISAILRQEMAGFTMETELEETGIILQVGDGIARVYGLTNAWSGEMVACNDDGLTGVVLNLEEDNAGVVLLGDSRGLREGDVVKRTGRIVSLKITEAMTGRVVNTLGEPIDGEGKLEGPFYEMPLERRAPEVIYRQPVNEPLQTGIKAIDAMIPIGRGQRELIIGDRQTGKTAIALDTIINQRRFYEKGEPVYCIYVAIGQKGSSVVNTVNYLKQHGAMDYTVVVSATASDPAAMQFYAPFAGMAIGEFYRDTGRHALVIFDDLSKQAVSYREVSLLLRRPPGRDAFPGDIFYLHSRLLERASKIIASDEIAAEMNDIPESVQPLVKGGGSLTALPIVESQAGDVSAYILTNVISITDGQIFLETHLFNAGIRPAVNVGVSVSRVGGNAQMKSMKKVAGTLKINQAQYRELEAFARFGTDLDPETRRILDKGARNVRVLKQDQFAPMPVSEQIAILYCGTKDLLMDIPIEKVEQFEKELIALLYEKYPGLLEQLENDVLDKNEEASLLEAAKIVKERLLSPQSAETGQAAGSDSAENKKDNT